MSTKTTKSREPLKAVRPQLDSSKRNTVVKAVTQGGITKKPALRTEKTPMKVSADTLKSPRLRSKSASATAFTQTKPCTPRNKCSIPAPTSAKSTIKPGWKRKPKHAHSGVPVPEKMRKMLDKLRENGDIQFKMQLKL